MPSLDVAILVGSLRAASFSRALARALIKLAPQGLAPQIVEIGDLALYNQDFDARSPEPYQAFRDRIRRCDAVLFVTPEYNRSIPGVLKNALDVGSRPQGQSVWDKKPAAVVSNTPYAMGGFGANHHLRQCLVFLNMPAMQQPEAYIAHVDTLVGPDDEVTNEASRAFLAGFMQSFEAWARANTPA